MVRYSIYLIPDYQRAFVVRNFRFLLQTPSNKPEFGKFDIMLRSRATLNKMSETDFCILRQNL